MIAFAFFNESIARFYVILRSRRAKFCQKRVEMKKIKDFSMTIFQQTLTLFFNKWRRCFCAETELIFCEKNRIIFGRFKSVLRLIQI